MSPPLWSGPFLAACGLLTAAGIGKLRDPEPAMIALSAAGLPARRGLVVAGGVGEAALGALAAATGMSVLAAAVGVVYLAFAAFILRSVSGGPTAASCGCFGRSATPPSVAHIALNVAGAGVAAAAAAGPTVTITSVLTHQPLLGVPFVLMTLTTAYAARLVFLYPPGRRPWRPT